MDDFRIDKGQRARVKCQCETFRRQLMNIARMKKTGLLLVAVLFCQAVQAKTVALWPIEYNQATGVWDGR